MSRVTAVGIPSQDYEHKLAKLRLSAGHPTDAWLCSTSRQHDELFNCWSLLLRSLSTPTGLGSWSCWRHTTRILASKLRPIMTKHDDANHQIYNMKHWKCQSLMTQMIYMISSLVRQPLKRFINLWANRRGLLLLRSQKPVPKRLQWKNILGALPKPTSLHPIQFSKNVVGVSNRNLLNQTKQRWSNSFLRHLVGNFASNMSFCLYIELYIVRNSCETSIGDQMISR